MECLESGVFRADLPTKFQLDPSAYEASVYKRKKCFLNGFFEIMLLSKLVICLQNLILFVFSSLGSG